MSEPCQGWPYGIKVFDWRELDGKRGTIVVGCDGGITVAAFRDEDDGHLYILHVDEPHKSEA